MITGNRLALMRYFRELILPGLVHNQQSALHRLITTIQFYLLILATTSSSPSKDLPT